MLCVCVCLWNYSGLEFQLLRNAHTKTHPFEFNQKTKQQLQQKNIESYFLSVCLCVYSLSISLFPFPALILFGKSWEYPVEICH